MLSLALTAQGLLDKSTLEAWTREKRDAIHRAVARGMQDGSKLLVAAARQRLQSSLTVRKATFLRSMRARLYDQKRDRLPALLIGSKVPWLGIHVRGGTIGGRMLIPLTAEGQRMGRRKFKRVVDALMRSGNAFFIQKGGRAILMAENLQENAGVLTPFKRAVRAQTGARRLKRGQEIPIAVLVPAVTLKPRFDLAGAIRERLPDLARAIETQLNAR